MIGQYPWFLPPPQYSPQQLQQIQQAYSGIPAVTSQPAPAAAPAIAPVMVASDDANRLYNDVVQRASDLIPFWATPEEQSVILDAIKKDPVRMLNVLTVRAVRGATSRGDTTIWWSMIARVMRGELNGLDGSDAGMPPGSTLRLNFSQDGTTEGWPVPIEPLVSDSDANKINIKAGLVVPMFGDSGPSLAAIKAFLSAVAILYKRAKLVADASAKLRAIFPTIPWPQSMMGSFPLNPQVDQAPFLSDAPIWDMQSLMMAGYFRDSQGKMETDIARWLAKSEDELTNHFHTVAYNWIWEEKHKAEAAASAWGPLNFVVQGIGGLLSILLPGIGTLISTAMQAGLKFGVTAVIGGQQKDMMVQIQKVMGISNEAMGKFSSWIAARVTAPHEGYGVIVEGKEIKVAHAGEVAQVVIGNSEPGDRVLVNNYDTDEHVLLVNMGEKGIWKVPAEQESSVLKIPRDVFRARMRQALGLGGKFPFWLLGLLLLG